MAAVVEGLADASAKRVVTIGGDDGVARVVHFGEAVVGVVDVASCVRRVGRVGLAEGVAVFVVGVADAAGLGELVVGVVAVAGALGIRIAACHSVGQGVVGVGLVCLGAVGLVGIGRAGQVVQGVVAVVRRALLGGLADDVAGKVVAVLVVHHLALAGVFDGEGLES